MYFNLFFCSNYDNEKIIKKQRIDIMPHNSITLLDLWANNLKKVFKQKKEFHGRLINPASNTAMLYTHLKLDEICSKPFR
jgi:hypothetical protein